MMQRVPKPWPSAKDLTELLDKAGSSFAFSATLIQFVGGDSMPHKTLQQLLESGADGLDPLYKQVLSSTSGDTHCTRMNVKVRKTRNKDQVPQEKP